MRIIAGIYKGRTIKFPKSNLVRPTTDKTKESIFNYLVHSMDFEKIKVCDVYAGSGSLGLEALSRGAEQVHFVEKDFHVSKMLEDNIRSLNAMENCKIYRTDAVKFSKMTEHSTYDLILVDPPFFKYDVHETVKNLMENNYLSQDGLMIVERSIQTKKEDEEAFRLEPFKKMGDSLIYHFRHE